MLHDANTLIIVGFLAGLIGPWLIIASVPFAGHRSEASAAYQRATRTDDDR